MKRYLLLTLLAGCATPGETIESGDRFDYTSARAAQAAAACVNRNGDELGAGIAANQRQGPADGELEVLVRNTRGETTVAVARVTPKGGGATITVWVSAATFGSRKGLADAMTKGC